MAAPWERYGAAPAAPSGPWAKYDIAKPRLADAVGRTAPVGRSQVRNEPYSGAILPFSRDAEGNVGFDPNAGLVGVGKRAFELPGQVERGEVDPRSDEGIDRAAEMALALSPVNPAVRAGERMIPGASRAVRPSRQPPTAEQLLAAGDAGYKSVRAAGVDFDAGAISAMASALRRELEAEFHPSLAKQSYKILRSLENPPEGSIATLAGLIAARDNFAAVAQNFNPKAARDQAVASRIIARLDEFIQAPPESAVLAGPAASAGRTYAEANANYGAGKRSNRLHNVEESAELRAAAANSGRNIGNTLRQRAADIVDPKFPARRSGFSPEEIELIELVAKGKAGRNTARYVGNLLGGGGGLGGVVTGGVLGGGAGAFAGNPIMGAIAGVGAPLIGYGAKSADNALTSKAFQAADEAVRRRSPLFSKMQNNPALATPISPAGRAAMMRALLLSGQSDYQTRFRK